MKNNKTIDMGSVIKMLVCIAAFLGSMVAFSYVSRDLPAAKEVVVSWLIRLSVSSVLFATMAGVVVVLVRPLWIVIVTYLLAAALYPLLIGVSATTVIAAVI